MNEQVVRAAIDQQITRREKRILVLEAENKGIRDTHPVRYQTNKGNIRCLNHSIDTLIELQHILRLCGCPTSAYQQEEVSTAESK